MSDDDVKAELARLKAENESLKRSMSKGISIKVSAKGAVSVYGLGRFPVTLYQEQWQRLIDLGPELRTFIQDNAGALKSKDAPAAAAPAPAAE